MAKEIELAEITTDSDRGVSEEEVTDSTTDGSTRPLRRHRLLGEEEEETAAAGEEEDKTAPGDKKDDTEPADDLLTFKDVKNALSNAQFLTRTGFFAAAAYFLVILPQRPNPPYWMKRTHLIKQEMQRNLIIEMVLAFSVMTCYHFALIMLEFVFTKSPRIRRGFAFVGPCMLAIFVTSWMVMYTLHVPFTYQREWHWIMTTFFIITNFGAAFIVGSRGVKIEEDKIIEM